MTPDQQALQPYLDFRERYNVPLWLGESGENTDEWVAQYVALLNKNDIGWAFWPYKKVLKTSGVVTIMPPEGWDQIVAFAKLPRDMSKVKERLTARPSQQIIDHAFDDFLENIQLEHCQINSGYLRSLGLKSLSSLQ
jgi:endoglucanase